ncbi:MAG: tRNA isopentenyl-2-thiomethyl-A-37 hydroxylase MiaE, partial [Pseudomonadota bacterium]
PVLPEHIALLYQNLLKSEARHFKDYLQLAQGFAEASSLDINVPDRIEAFLQTDAQLITSGDAEFRFHSGVPS